MSTRRNRSVAALAALGVALGAAIAPAVRPEPAHATLARADLAGEVLAQQNEERTARGLSPFTNSSTLAAIAQEWAVVLAGRNTISHRDINWVLANSGGMIAVGENLAASSETTGSTTYNLMNSPVHRENLLNPYFDRAGVGVACTDSGMLFVVINYGQTSGTGQPHPGIPPASPQVVSLDRGSRCGAGTTATLATTTRLATTATTATTQPTTAVTVPTTKATLPATTLSSLATTKSTSRSTVRASASNSAAVRGAAAARTASTTLGPSTGLPVSSLPTASPSNSTVSTAESSESTSASTQSSTSSVPDSLAKMALKTEPSPDSGLGGGWLVGLGLAVAACAVTGVVMVRRPQGQRSR